MAVILTFAVDGLKQVSRRIERFSVLIKNPEPVWTAIADDFLRTERRQFGSEGQAGSGGWEPLSDAYATWKARYYSDSPLLQLSGALVNSLTWPGAPGQVRDITPYEVVLGTTVPYASAHQLGTDRMPARPPIELTEEDRVRWLKYLQRWIMDEAGAL